MDVYYTVLRLVVTTLAIGATDVLSEVQCPSARGQIACPVKCCVDSALYTFTSDVCCDDTLNNALNTAGNIVGAVSNGLSIVIIVVIVISVLVFLGIVACIVCCVCAATKPSTSTVGTVIVPNPNVAVVTPGPQAPPYNTMPPPNA